MTATWKGSKLSVISFTPIPQPIMTITGMISRATLNGQVSKQTRKTGALGEHLLHGRSHSYAYCQVHLVLDGHRNSRGVLGRVANNRQQYEPDEFLAHAPTRRDGRDAIDHELGTQCYDDGGCEQGSACHEEVELRFLFLFVLGRREQLLSQALVVVMLTKPVDTHQPCRAHKGLSDGPLPE